MTTRGGAAPVGGTGTGGEPAALSTTGSLERALLARRVVLVTGTFDAARASDVSAALMALDATGDAPIELRLQGASGGIDAALMAIDVIGVLGVPVDTVGSGIIQGGPVAVLATGDRRRLSPHARVHLGEPDMTLAGRASELERALAAHAARRDEFLSHLAERTGRPLAEVSEEWSRGSTLGAEDALALGYVDAIEKRKTARPAP